MKKYTAFLALLSLLATAGAALATDEPSLPKGYQKWAKSKARIEPDKKSLFYGIHYIYVDPKAMKTYRSGGVYPDGARFVAVNHAIRQESGKQVPGKKTMIVLMQKDRKEQATGGWLFAGFTPEGKPSGLDGKRDCFGCHEKDARDRDYVISRYADFK